MTIIMQPVQHNNTRSSYKNKIKREMKLSYHEALMAILKKHNVDLHRYDNFKNKPVTQ
jgi:hypothetical protein